MRLATSKTRLRVFPEVAPHAAQFGPHSKEHWSGGVKIKMTLGLAKTQGKVNRLLGKCKTKVGSCWRSFIQSKLSRGSHSPSRVRNAKIKEHNTGMTETRAVRVEQNTRHKAEPSTLTKYIDALIK